MVLAFKRSQPDAEGQSSLPFGVKFTLLVLLLIRGAAGSQDGPRCSPSGSRDFPRLRSVNIRATEQDRIHRNIRNGVTWRVLPTHAVCPAFVFLGTGRCQRRAAVSPLPPPPNKRSLKPLRQTARRQAQHARYSLCSGVFH